MEITYKETKDFTPEELKRLFLSVNWESANYPEKLARAMKNSSLVISAWDNDRLIGLIRALDDGETLAYVHYVLVDPEYHSYHVGGTMLKKMLEHYKDLLYIKVTSSDKATVAFFEKYGFQYYDNYTHMEIVRV